MKKIIITAAFILLLLSGLSWRNPWWFFSPKEDLYYTMNGANLNTMNSYVVPSEAKINPENYEPLHYQLQKSEDGWSLKKITSWSIITWLRVHIMSTYPGYIIMWVVLVLFWFFAFKFPESMFGQVTRLIFEWVYWFFEDIIGVDRPYWMKQFVVSLFFIILLSNLFGVVNDIIRFFMPQYLRVVTAPTWEFETNIALAIISIVVTLWVQAKALWWGVMGWVKLLHEYVPITWKWLIQWGIWAKIWDIFISLFIWLLDIIGTFAKIISLSIRLLWNMSSGSILLNVIFIGIGMATVWLIWFNAPIGIPIIVYMQSLLSSIIQAFVFALLVGIGLSMAQWD